jgi:glycerate 2-kinase
MYIKNREELISHGDRDGRSLALEILEGGLAAADPYANTRKLIRMKDSELLIGGYPERDVSGYGDEEIDLSCIENIYVVGAGKSVQRQAKALEDILGARLTAGAITIKKGEEIILENIEVTEGAHPVPDEGSVAGTKKIVEIANRAGEKDLVFTLFSDGVSSLAPLPAADVTLDDLRALYKLAIEYGSQSIIVNPMAYFSQVSRGRLMKLIQPARSVNLIMQVGLFERWHGELPKSSSFALSWPPGTRRMADDILDFQHEPWWDKLPHSMRSVFARRDPAYDVPNLEDFSKMRFSFWQPIDLYQMVDGACATAEKLGLKGVALCSHLATFSSSAASVLAQIAHQCEKYGRPFEPPVALITGGHLEVPTGGTNGVGGRNQEFALLWAKSMTDRRFATKRVVVAAMDSDGTDGPGTQLTGGEYVCMAGGVVDRYTMEEALEKEVNVDAELANHNSTIALMNLGSAIHTGNTGMAHGDLRVAVIR